MVLLLMTLVFQESYYVDGTEFILRDGTVIKTIERIEEDLYNYTFKEGGDLIIIPRSRVKTVNFFAYEVKGRRPPKQYKNIHQRRIRGRPVVYLRAGVKHLRLRHVDQNGKNREGMVSRNVVRDLWLDESGESVVARYALHNPDPSEILQFTFYNFEGKPIFRASSMVDQLKIDRKSDAEGWFEVPQSLSWSKVGLIEVFPVPAHEGKGQ